MIRYILLIIIFYISVYSSCSKTKECDRSTQYAFKLNISATPGTDSINLGDTLWFIINESTQLYDFISNATVDFSEAYNLSYVFAVHKVVSSTNFTPAADSFQYVVKTGQYVGSLNPTYLREYSFKEEGGRYKMEIGIVPQKKGVFTVLVETAANVFSRKHPCSKASFGIKFSNADQHFYLGYNISGEQVYYFKVY